jgi:thiol-disulfide isomerase/thioredoxin
MKPLLLAFLIFVCSKIGFSQDFNLDSIYQKYKGTDTTVYAYMTALWCSPCLEKMPYIDAFFNKTTKPYKIIYLFDIDKFTWKTLAKIFPFIDFTDKINFIPKKFYPSASIQINGHNKMFKNFIAAHKSFSPTIQNLESFTLSSILVVSFDKEPYVFDLPKLNGLNMDAIDSIFSK